MLLLGPTLCTSHADNGSTPDISGVADELLAACSALEPVEPLGEPGEHAAYDAFAQDGGRDLAGVVFDLEPRLKNSPSEMGCG